MAAAREVQGWRKEEKKGKDQERDEEKDAAEKDRDHGPRMRTSAWSDPGSCARCRARPGPAALRGPPSREPDPKRRETLLRARRDRLLCLPAAGECLGTPVQLPGPVPVQRFPLVT